MEIETRVAVVSIAGRLNMKTQVPQCRDEELADKGADAGRGVLWLGCGVGITYEDQRFNIRHLPGSSPFGY